MSDETTPLTSAAIPPQGPSYVFPGGVSPRLRRRKMCRLQWCIGLSLLAIVIAALVLALILSDLPQSDVVVDVPLVLTVNETQIPMNATAIREVLESTQTPISDEPEAEWALDKLNITRSQGEQAIGVGMKALGDREILEEGLQSTPVNSPAFRHYRSLSSNTESRKLSRRGYVENHATKQVADWYNYTKSPGRSNIGHGPDVFLPDPTLNFTCNFNARYRTNNGICNNKMEPRNYGAAMIPYRRMVAPDYADGISQPRESHTGQLPPARSVSLKIYRPSFETDSNFTVMLAVFGQFLDHDITATSLSTAQDGESLDCCNVPLNVHPECFPVKILNDDPFYVLYNVTCMNFVRSSPAPTGHFGPRQQLNQATAFIDGSVVYGTSDLRVTHLRTLTNGTLRMFETLDGRELLPISTNPDDGCNRVQMIREGKYCFESGDDRANENLLLTSMHLLWARHHNYLAQGLQEANPKWSDETVFQESRKILSAQIAHIAYNEFLPILLGREFVEKKGLLSDVDDLNAPDTYDVNVDPSVANSFASAAFRFAHTLLPGLFNLTADNTTSESIELHKMLFNPFSLWKERGIDNALNTAINTPVLRVDRFFSVEMTQKLFEDNVNDEVTPTCGLDLVSLNLQRGRDHGLPAYPVFRKHCNLPSVDTWADMGKAMDPTSLESIRQIYDEPEDVDVYTGALSEPPMEGAIFGPLLSCIVSDQFLRLKQGDSHWYERKIGPQKFTKDQLREIYKTTLAKIICRNSDNIQQVRKFVMERTREIENEYLDCNDIKNFNFTYWTSNKSKSKLNSARVSQAVSLVRVMSSKVNANQSFAAMGAKSLVEPAPEPIH